MREVLRQKRYHPLQDYEQIIVMLALIHGLFDPIPPEQVAQAEKELCEMAVNRLSHICADITAGKELTEAMQDEILTECRSILAIDEKEEQ